MSKAEGDFLWVGIVVSLLQDGIRNDDRPKELRKQLYSLPPTPDGKKGLYVNMLKNMQPRYRQQTSKLAIYGVKGCAVENC